MYIQHTFMYVRVILIARVVFNFSHKLNLFIFYRSIYYPN